MICPHCKEEGKTSRVTGGNSQTTCMWCPPYYDEQGKYHSHDSNITTTSYSCSNGHAFVVKSYGKCWCGWTNEPQPEQPTKNEVES